MVGSLLFEATDDMGELSIKLKKVDKMSLVVIHMFVIIVCCGFIVYFNCNLG